MPNTDGRPGIRDDPGVYKVSRILGWMRSKLLRSLEFWAFFPGCLKGSKVWLVVFDVYFQKRVVQGLHDRS